MYHYTPPSTLLTILYPGETFILKIIINPVLLHLKIIPLALLASMKKLSNDIMSTGLGDKLYSTYTVVVLNPRRSLILSSGTKFFTNLCGDYSTIDPRVEKLGLI